ncbi:MAG TPA: cyclic nucleotide-binding domain-containing protein [Gammaproteobacteria bacterium]
MATNNLGKWYAPQECVVIAGEAGNSMFVVLSGTLEVLGGEPGNEQRIGTLTEGDIFGEMALFEKERRSATVRALDEAFVLTLDKRTLLRRIKEDPLVALNLIETLCRRTRKLNGELAQLRAAQQA